MPDFNLFIVISHMPTNTSSSYFKIRSAARSCILNVLGAKAHPAPGIHILNGHRINGETEPDTFHNLLFDLSKTVEFIRFEDAVRMIKLQENPDKPLVAFSFDDGFIECYDIFAPVLESFGTNAMFFINPNYVDGSDEYIKHFDNNIVMTEGKKPMRWKHIQNLDKRGFLIGAHTMDHYMINSEKQEILTYQIVNCKETIEQHLDKPCEYFAFPYGKLTEANDTSIDIACKTYKYVFSQSDYKHYFSFGGKVINRRHFEPFWPVKHVKHFLSCNKQY